MLRIPVAAHLVAAACAPAPSREVDQIETMVAADVREARGLRTFGRGDRGNRGAHGVRPGDGSGGFGSDTGLGPRVGSGARLSGAP